MQIGFIDISWAHFNAKIDSNLPTCVQLFLEDPDAGLLCAELLRHIYGTCAAMDG